MKDARQTTHIVCLQSRHRIGQMTSKNICTHLICWHRYSRESRDKTSLKPVVHRNSVAFALFFEQNAMLRCTATDAHILFWWLILATRRPHGKVHACLLSDNHKLSLIVHRKDCRCCGVSEWHTSGSGRLPRGLRGRRWKTYGSCCTRTASIRAVSRHTSFISDTRFNFQPWG